MQSNKLNIGLIGYGKMGKTIEKLAASKGHNIILRISSSNALELNAKNLKSLDVAIEFTNPDAAPKNLEILAENKIPTVCGSTAWLHDYDRICNLYQENQTPFLYASNFSIGVNIFFKLNRYLAQLMNVYSAYDVNMLEVHHTEKKDAPSGTAVTLAETVITTLDRKEKWVNDQSTENKNLDIISERKADVKGTHVINYTSQIDDISIAHIAHSRDGFASGALLASEWIQNKKGIFSFEDVMDSKNI